MKEFQMLSGTQIKEKDSSKTMVIHYLIALFPILIFSWYKNGLVPYLNKDVNVFGLLKPFFWVLVPAFISYLLEVFYARISKKVSFKEAILYSFRSYSIFVGLFLGLLLPIHTTFLELVLGSIVASFLGKFAYGGFGNNKLNPSLVGFLFIIIMYGSVISSHGGYLNPTEIKTLAQTPIEVSTQMDGIGSYERLVEPFGNLWDFFFGTIPGAIGTTSACLCILAYLYLSFTNVIKWRISLIYVLTVFAITFLIGNYHELGIWYPTFQILNGGLIFGAVFLATDPVTSPTTPVGQVLYALFLGILTVIFRYMSPFTEDVAISILVMNLFVFLFDIIGSRARFNFKVSILPFVISWIGIITLGVYLGTTL